MSFKHAVSAIVLVTLCGSSVRAQQVDCRRRTVPISIITEDGGPRPYLSSPNLRASVGGKNVRVDSIAFDAQPHRIILLLDASDSITSGDLPNWDVPSWNSVLDVANDLLVQIPTANGIGLAVFASQMDVLAAPTADRKILLDAIARMR